MHVDLLTNVILYVYSVLCIDMCFLALYSSFLPLVFVSLVANPSGTGEPVDREVVNFSVDLNAKCRIIIIVVEEHSKG